MLRPIRPLARIDVGDLGLDVLATWKSCPGLSTRSSRAGCVDQALEPFFDLHEHAEVGGAGDVPRILVPTG